MMKRLISLLFAVLVLMAILSPAVLAADTTPANVVDKAGLLTGEEDLALSQKAAEIGAKHNCDVVFVLTSDLEGYATKIEYADDYYDYNGYKPDGVLVLLTMQDENGSRGIYTSTTGRCIRRFNESEQDQVYDDVYYDLVNADYYDALMSYADGIDYHLSPHVPLKNLLIAIAVGFVIAMIISRMLKNQLQSVSMQKSADNYVRPGSMVVSRSRDTFLYSTVTRTAKPKDNDRSTHSGSSGTSHGGSGHSF